MTSLAADGDEYLEDGTRVRTPSGDNLVLDYARLEADAFASIVESWGGRILDDPDAGLPMCDLAIATRFGNVALVTHPIVDSATPDVIRRLTDFYSQRAGGPFLVFSPWRTSDWSTHGLHRVGHPPLMLRPAGGAGPTVEALDIVTVTTRRPRRFRAHPDRGVPGARTPTVGAGLLFIPTYSTPRGGSSSDTSGPSVATAAAFLGPRLTIIEFVSTRPDAGVAATARRSPGRRAWPTRACHRCSSRRMTGWGSTSLSDIYACCATRCGWELAPPG